MSQPQASKPNPRAKQTHAVVASREDNSDENLHLYRMGQNGDASKVLTCALQIEDKAVDMEVDTGTDVSIISEKTHQQVPQL